MKYAPRNILDKFSLLTSIIKHKLQNVKNYLEFLTLVEYIILSSFMENIRIKAHYAMKKAPRNFRVKFPLLTTTKMRNLQNFENYLEFLTLVEYTN